jgi:hypothetical protein
MRHALDFRLLKRALATSLVCLFIGPLMASFPIFVYSTFMQVTKWRYSADYDLLGLKQFPTILLENWVLSYPLQFFFGLTQTSLLSVIFSYFGFSNSSLKFVAAAFGFAIALLVGAACNWEILLNQRHPNQLITDYVFWPNFLLAHACLCFGCWLIVRKFWTQVSS